MKLYHVTFNTDEPKIKTFIPRIPKWIIDTLEITKNCDENSTIPRICFSSSIETAIQALSEKSRDLKTGASLLVYELEVDKNDPLIISPEELFSKGYVIDALENREYWYLKEVTLVAKEYKITDFDMEYDFAWSVINPDEIKEIAEYSEHKKPMIQNILESHYVNSKDIYDDLYELAEENKCLNFIDDLYERISEIPWAQIVRVNKLCLA